jgi:hypothetical protein
VEPRLIAELQTNGQNVNARSASFGLAVESQQINNASSQCLLIGFEDEIH